MFKRQFVLIIVSLSACCSVVFAAKKKEREEPIFNVTAEETRQPSLSAERQAEFFDYIVKGFGAEGRDDYAAALSFYDRALAVNKESVTVWIRHAYSAAKLGRYEVAAQDLRLGVDCRPVSVTDYLTLAWFLATNPFPQMRDGTKAVAYAQKALGEEATADAYDILAAGYAEMGNFGRAQENLRVAIKLFPDSGRGELLRKHLELYKNRKPWREVWGRDEKQMNEAVKGR